MRSSQAGPIDWNPGATVPVGEDGELTAAATVGDVVDPDLGEADRADVARQVEALPGVESVEAAPPRRRIG